jgi:hypothetical protein
VNRILVRVVRVTNGVPILAIICQSRFTQAWGEMQEFLALSILQEYTLP